jgi:hypothetical protein
MYMVDVQMIDWAVSKMLCVDADEAPMHHDALHAPTLPILIYGCAEVHACAEWYIALYSMKFVMCNDTACVLTSPRDAAKPRYEA